MGSKELGEIRPRYFFFRNEEKGLFGGGSLAHSS